MIFYKGVIILSHLRASLSSMFPEQSAKQVFTMPVTHWPICAFSQKCLPEEGNETSSSSQLH